METRSEYMIEGIGLCKRYRLGDSKVNALQDVRIRVKQGEFIAIVGPSGSGKSTLLHVLAGLDKPDSGTIHINGRNISGLKESELARMRNTEIGFIFQNFNLISVLNVYENVEYPCMAYSDSKQYRKNIVPLLKEVGIYEHRHKKPNQLSGGQRQRVGIARAFVNSPGIIFADEPTANLDRATGETILRIMKDMNRKHGTTFIYSTHDPLVMEKADRIVQIADGKIEPTKAE